MDAFLKDVKHSIRMFLKNPSFTLTAIAALTLGIGANTAIFSIVNTAAKAAADSRPGPPGGVNSNARR